MASTEIGEISAIFSCLDFLCVPGSETIGPDGSHADNNEAGSTTMKKRFALSITPKTGLMQANDRKLPLGQIT
jgi:hypothetical protein